MTELLSGAQVTQPVLVAVIAVSSVAVFELLRWWLSALVRHLRARFRARRARAGELAAEDLLRRLGYRIAERQPSQSYEVIVDGEPLRVDLRADLIVTRGGCWRRSRSFVAEVKTGAGAPRISNKATRRQLLEYAVAYRDAEGVLLVDAEAGSVREVLFPLPSRTKAISWLPFAVAIALAGASIMGLAVMHR